MTDDLHSVPSEAAFVSVILGDRSTADLTMAPRAADLVIQRLHPEGEARAWILIEEAEGALGHHLVLSAESARALIAALDDLLGQASPP